MIYTVTVTFKYRSRYYHTDTDTDTWYRWNTTYEPVTCLLEGRRNRHRAIAGCTQMTKLTFHYAGVATVNATQGLPRIIEIVDARKVPNTTTMKPTWLNGVSCST